MSDGNGRVLSMFNTFINKHHTLQPSGPKNQIHVGGIVVYVRWMPKYLVLSWNASNMQSPPPQNTFMYKRTSQISGKM